MHFLKSVSALLGASAIAQAAFPRDPAAMAKQVDAQRAAQREATIEKRVANEPFKNAELQKRASRWLTEQTQKFEVNGTAIPEVDFDIGESYAGLLPISDDPNETRKLFFWFFPTTNPECKEEVTVWFNGGPGCSSLSGLLTENGPFTWEAGTYAPVQNPYTWANLTNMMWIEQPVGVGFSQGVPDITNEVELAQEFLGFFKQFTKTFCTEGYSVYLTGESYAGYYVPYIADAFIKADDPTIPLKGIAINDPIIADGTTQQQVTIQPYVEYWSELFYLNETFRGQLAQRHEECGYKAHMDKYLTYPPPPGPFPVLPDPYATDNYTCDQFSNAYGAALDINPCFNIYHITETCPKPYSVLGKINRGDYIPPGTTGYFNRTDVQDAINAPHVEWFQCTPTNVFGGAKNNQSLSDTSKGPAVDGTLQRVIEYTNNTIIGSGNLDLLLNTNGTLLAIQNMTWNGMQGLQAYPSTEFYSPFHPETVEGSLAGAGIVGQWGEERGLTFYQVQLAGHELPGYAAGAGYRTLEVLLGRVKNLSEMSDFTTQTGNFTGNGTIYF